MKTAGPVARILLAGFCFCWATLTVSEGLTENAPAQHPAPSSSPHADLGKFLLEKAEALVGYSPVRYKNHISRGIGLSEAVVRLSGGSLDLTNVLNNIGEQPNRLLWQRLGSEGIREGDPIGPISYMRTPSGVSSVSTEALRPGLYEVSLMQWDGDMYRLAGVSSAWVLICDESTFTEDDAAFRDAQRKLDASTSVEPSRKKQLLRAALDLLAQQRND